jgi:hypothetical protein
MCTEAFLSFVFEVSRRYNHNMIFKYRLTILGDFGVFCVMLASLYIRMLTSGRRLSIQCH